MPGAFIIIMMTHLILVFKTNIPIVIVISLISKSNNLFYYRDCYILAQWFQPFCEYGTLCFRKNFRGTLQSQPQETIFP